jgi:uncharacterized protein
VSDPASSALEPPPVPTEDPADGVGGRTDPGESEEEREGGRSENGADVGADGADVDGGIEEESPAAEGEAGSPAFSVALVVSVSVDLPSQHPTVVLRELEPPRRQLSFSVALPDGVTLSHAVRRIPTPRPLTQELLSTVIQGFAIDVIAVRLVGRQGAVYFAEIDLRSKDKRAVYSCRPSDAITVALLQPVPVPILIDRRLLEETGDVVPAPTVPPG